MCLREQSVVDADYPFGEEYGCTCPPPVFSRVVLVFGFSFSSRQGFIHAELTIVWRFWT